MLLVYVPWCFSWLCVALSLGVLLCQVWHKVSTCWFLYLGVLVGYVLRCPWVFYYAKFGIKFPHVGFCTLMF